MKIIYAHKKLNVQLELYRRKVSGLFARISMRATGLFILSSDLKRNFPLLCTHARNARKYLCYLLVLFLFAMLVQRGH